MTRRIHTLESSLSVAALLAMALLPLLEILIRQFSSSGIPGSTVWVQHLALWVAFLGAALAARKGELLSLSTSLALRGRTKTGVEIVTAGVSFAVCMVLAKGGLDLVLAEREGGQALALGLPLWIAQVIIPVGFAVIGLRVVLRLSSGWRGRAAAVAFVLVPWLMGQMDNLPGSGIATPLFLVLVAAAALGTPIFVALGGMAALLLWNNFDPVSAIAVETYSLSIKPLLPTIPLFTLAGYILAEGDHPKRLIELFRALFGWTPGGVAVMASLVCAFFTSFTGGSGVTILAMGGLLYPMLLQEKHSARFDLGLLTAAGSLGLLLPPSLAVILYGLVAKIEIKKLFVSGLVPALLEIGLVAFYAMWQGRKAGIDPIPFQWRRVLRALWAARWEVAAPVVVLAGILGGFATLVEAATLTVLYAFVLEFIVHRELSIRHDLIRVVANASSLIGGVLIILGVALGLTNYFVIAGIPDLAVERVQGLVQSRLLFLLLLNIFLLVVGCLMDIYSAIVVVVPLIVPLGVAYGIDPFHLGVIFLVNLELGYLTPPVGINLFLASFRFKRPLSEVYSATLPFLALRAVSVLLITYVPPLTGLLPRILSMGQPA
ncbi:MAG: TRAP transporter large permease subunit [Acidobacteriota bacterium]